MYSTLLQLLEGVEPINAAPLDAPLDLFRHFPLREHVSSAYSSGLDSHRDFAVGKWRTISVNLSTQMVDRGSQVYSPLPPDMMQRVVQKVPLLNDLPLLNVLEIAIIEATLLFGRAPAVLPEIGLDNFLSNFIGVDTYVSESSFFFI